MDFKKLNIREEIIDLLSQRNIITPTQIQKDAIPYILNGLDVLAKAPTGTGKTATYVIPIIQKMINDSPSFNPKVLVLSPTRELSKQILDTFNFIKKPFDFKITSLIGGESISKQIRHLEKGIDIVVATPGRVIDLLKQKKINFESIKYFVLDEVDLLLDMGFQKDIKLIHNNLPKKIQTIFLSATIDKEIKKMIDTLLKPNYKYVETKHIDNKGDNIKQNVIYLEKKNKPKYLIELIQNNPNKKFIIFINTKKVSNYISRCLNESKIKASIIHGDKSQIFREKALNAFKNEKTKVLIATDVASRGIHINDVNFVINYDVPNNRDTYTHRIGRTGRANNIGESFTLVCDDELFYLNQIKKDQKREINIIKNHIFSKNLDWNEIKNSKPVIIGNKRKNNNSPKKYFNDKNYETKKDLKRKNGIAEFNERVKLKKSINEFKWGNNKQKYNKQSNLKNLNKNHSKSNIEKNRNKFSNEGKIKNDWNKKSNYRRGKNNH